MRERARKRDKIKPLASKKLAALDPSTYTFGRVSSQMDNQPYYLKELPIGPSDSTEVAIWMTNKDWEDAAMIAESREPDAVDPDIISNARTPYISETVHGAALEQFTPNREFSTERLSDAQRYVVREGILPESVLHGEHQRRPQIYLSVDTSTNCIALSRRVSKNKIHTFDINTGRKIADGVPSDIGTSYLDIDQNGETQYFGSKGNYFTDDDSSMVQTTLVDWTADEKGISLATIKELAETMGANPAFLRWGHLAGEQTVPYADLTPKQQQEVLIDAMGAILSHKVRTREDAQDQIEVIDGLSVLTAQAGMPLVDLGEEEHIDAQRLTAGAKYGATPINRMYVHEALHEYAIDVSNSQLESIGDLEKLLPGQWINILGSQKNEPIEDVSQAQKSKELVEAKAGNRVLGKVKGVASDMNTTARVEIGGAAVFGTGVPFIPAESLAGISSGVAVFLGLAAVENVKQRRMNRRIKAAADAKGLIVFDHNNRPIK